MGFSTIKRFDPRFWVRLVKYSIGSRLINSLPKGLKSTYDFFVMLERKNISYRKENNFFHFQYEVNSKRCDFCLAQDASDTLVFSQIIFEKEYEPIIEIFKKQNLTPENMVDAGANIGLTSVYFKAYYPDLKIIALEPSKNTFQRLKQNIEMNNLSAISFLQKGLWSKETRLKEDRSFRDGQDWSFRLAEANPGEQALFETVTIPKLFTESNLTSLDFLKIDIEGGEKEVFTEISDLSWLNKVKIIAVEIHDEFNCRNQIETILTNAGFELTHTGELTVGVNKALCNQ